MPLENAIKKKIEGATFNECKEKLFNLYGKNFTIMDKYTELRPAGLFKLKQKPVQVVTYVVTNPTESENSQTQKTSYSKPAGMTEEEQFQSSRKAILEKQKETLMNAQLAKMAEVLEKLNDKVESIEVQTPSASTETHPSISRIEEMLSENEFSFNYIKMISEKIRSQFSLEQLEDFKLVERYVVDWIGESIEIKQDKHVRPPKVVIIVGPTGVGKTTTIAKLAANSILEAKKVGINKPELCIVTIDTMRVGALEQLAKFGEILGKNVLKAETADDVKEIYSQYKEHVDYIFIDTSGYSPNDSNHIGQMKNILDVKMNPEVHLAVTASTKASDLQNIIRNYEPFAYESVIITKFDESQCYGNIISVLWEKHKCISYITNGQGVPRDIYKANIVDILINLKGFDIDRVHIEDKFGEQ
ncbi:MAG: hypothetical protein MJ179_03650 [Treponema sp.]|nr:hypothetical protein [Treponema sp.]